MPGEIKIDTTLIPDEARDRLAASTLKAFLAYIREPGNIEKLDARIAGKKCTPA